MEYLLESLLAVPAQYTQGGINGYTVYVAQMS